MSMLARESDKEMALVTISGVEEPVLSQYFTALNAGEFEAVSQLFAVDGMLQPPFDEPLVGRDAIAAYLEREAQGFLLQPQSGTAAQQDDSIEYEILGKVQTPWFSVNVCWSFILSSTKEILLAKVKLLASLKELLPLRDAAKSV
ncbi:MAG: ketosteroid isomerase family protein [Leptolyngbyaceae cyanobacterium bins.302]|nr:ketosteroid isomerase family protein [Leptolyngbyaceae cyanobacterium bins.302]